MSPGCGASVVGKFLHNDKNFNRGGTQLGFTQKERLPNGRTTAQAI